jgi:TatD DNase family protein
LDRPSIHVQGNDNEGIRTAMTMLVDSHCHLDFPDFAQERAAIVQRAAEAGVGVMITISTRVRKLSQIIEITNEYSNVFCSVGTHPHNAHEENDITIEEITNLSIHQKVVAIGEAGLDYFYDKSPRDAQETGFRRHIAAARQTGLPLVIHSRDADDDMAAILREETGRGAFPFVLHCFSSGRALAETGIELGGYVSFSGILTFPKSAEIRQIAKALPADRILVETDAPYLAPPPHRGKRNEPAYVVNTARVLAETRGVSPEEIAMTTTANFFRLFTKVPRGLLA